MKRMTYFGLPLLMLFASTMVGCNASLLLNPSFLNQQTGEVFPLVPGDRTGFVLVRANNSSSVAIEFVITAERRLPSEDDPAGFTVEKETYRLLTQPQQAANDLGVLIECPVFRLGLGEDLDRPNTDPGLFVGATAVGAGGFGVPSNVNPLNSDSANFDCGDTVVFQAQEAPNTAGGIVARSFVLDDEGFSGDIIGLDTFGNARALLEEQRITDQ
ncbi:MAG TPA: hypothetical protein PKN33_18905 [Phycisphaerae bacterium]|nr:hypothetical protein [Phycisphaerales bacterium]HNO80122.1 hypothetical protein [Phycisphaerae bacterium]